MTMATIGYGDITPTNNTEIFFATITMFIASGVFAYTLNSIGTIFNNLNEEKKNSQYFLLLNHSRK
jgi:cyclic nucleotide gated channel alpha 1